MNYMNRSTMATAPYSTAASPYGTTSPAQYTPQQFTQMAQQIFPQPSGNVYSINNNLEVANIPTGVGMSVALCFAENLMYIKTMQNGMPMLLGYKLSPLEPPGGPNSPIVTEEKTETAAQVDTNFTEVLKSYDEKIATLESTIEELRTKIGGIEQCRF